MRPAQIPEATVARLPRYLEVLLQAAARGDETISSDGLARDAGVNSANVRKDLSYLGTYGTRGVGYDVAELATEISRVLGLTSDRRVVIVGLGNLGRALASYGGFAERSFRVTALLDADPAKIGTEVGGVRVESMIDVDAVVAREGISIAIVATPAAAAQPVADALVGAGVTAILNFAPATLRVPDHVRVRRVDVSSELQILSFYQQLGDRGTEAAGETA